MAYSKRANETKMIATVKFGIFITCSKIQFIFDVLSIHKSKALTLFAEGDFSVT